MNMKIFSFIAIVLIVGLCAFFLIRKNDYIRIPEDISLFECSSPTGDRIYRTGRSGDDTFWFKFFDGNRKLLEETPEIGLGTPNRYIVKTQVKDCLEIDKNDLSLQNIFLVDPLFCLKDSDCVMQGTSCNGCGCSVPKNKYNQKQLDCTGNSSNYTCDLWCEPKAPKCEKNICIAEKQQINDKQ